MLYFSVQINEGIKVPFTPWVFLNTDEVVFEWIIISGVAVNMTVTRDPA